MNERGPGRTVIKHANGFTMVNTRELEPSIEPLFFQINVSSSFTQRFQVKKVGHTLLDMIREEDRSSIMLLRKKKMLKKKVMEIRSSWPQ